MSTGRRLGVEHDPSICSWTGSTSSPSSSAGGCPSARSITPSISCGRARSSEASSCTNDPSRQYSDLFPLDEAEVDRRAETRPVHGVDESLTIDVDILGEPVLLGARRQQDLEELAVPDGHRHVEVRHVVERVATVVDLEVHVKGLGQVRRLHEGREATLDGDVAAKEVGRLVDEPRRKGGETARRVLGGQDGDGQMLLELDVAQEVVVREGILVPIKPQLLDGPSDAERLRVLVGPGRIEHDGEAVAD